jgi:hypothetical protein
MLRRCEEHATMTCGALEQLLVKRRHRFGFLDWKYEL